MNGTRFGRLTVLELASGGVDGPLHSKKSGVLAKCRCVCGDVRWYRAVELRAGKRLSCPGAHPCSVCGGMMKRHAAHMRFYHPEIGAGVGPNVVPIRRGGVA